MALHDLDTFCATVVSPECLEPSTHLEATELAQRALRLLGESPDAIKGDMSIARFPSLLHSSGGFIIHWQERVVLCGLLDGEVWIYHPGSWEQELSLPFFGEEPLL